MALHRILILRAVKGDVTSLITSITDTSFVPPRTPTATTSTCSRITSIVRVSTALLRFPVRTCVLASEVGHIDWCFATPRGMTGASATASRASHQHFYLLFFLMINQMTTYRFETQT